jgi:hypothetical protein
MKQKTNQILFDYWNEVRGDRMAPRRFEIEPARIAAILPETFILERLDSESFMYRLAGTKLCEQFGVEFRGTNFLDGWGNDDHALLSQHLVNVCTQGGVLAFDLETGPVEQRGRKVQFEVVMLPLMHTGSVVTRLVGAMSAINPPAWVGSERLVHKSVATHNLLWPEGRPHSIAEKFRSQAPLLASLAGARLVKVDRRSFRVLDGGLSKGASKE